MSRFRFFALASIGLLASCGDDDAGECVHMGTAYDVEETFPAGDGCNTCTCLPGGDLACTRLACIDAGVDGGGADGGRPDAGGPDGGGSDAGEGMPCATDGSSSLAGVRIEFPDQRCTFTLAEAAEGITIAHRVVVNEDLRDVSTEAQDAGRCAGPGPSGLIVHEVLDGGDERYCVCDEGLCIGDPVVTSLTSGTHDDAFTWQGRNWGGPSDTGMLMGAPFPPGTYTLTVSSVGEHEGARYAVEGTFEIHLVE